MKSKFSSSSTLDTENEILRSDGFSMMKKKEEKGGRERGGEIATEKVVLTLSDLRDSLVCNSGSGSVDFHEFVAGLSAFSSRGERDEKLKCSSFLYFSLFSLLDSCDLMSSSFCEWGFSCV